MRCSCSEADASVGDDGDSAAYDDVGAGGVMVIAA